MKISSKKIERNENPIPFVRPYVSENTSSVLHEALCANHLQGDGLFTKKCHHLLEEQLHCEKALLTHSCTGALEMAALLIDLEEDDEVIMPSYTFSSTATAVALRKARPVFVDIREDTLNIDERLVESAITPKTKAILPVHYAGIAANMETITALAKKHHLFVIEDAAQGVGATYQNKPLGTLGDLGAYSFHGTKNIVSGEGGALIINNARFSDRAEIIREKGTNRSQFLRGEIDKYTWQDIGSSYLPNELTAAFLYSQLVEMEDINNKRLKVWEDYHEQLQPLEAEGLVVRPTVPKDCKHNGHIYYLLVESEDVRNRLLIHMKEHGVHCTSHYVPLHSSPAGLKYGRVHGDMHVTNKTAGTIIRLPLWPHMDYEHTARVVGVLTSFFRSK